MKIILFAIALIIAAAFISHTTIEFSPFHISCRYWYRGVGFILFLIGMVMMQAGDYRMGYEDGVNEVINVIEDYKKENTWKQK